MNLEQLFLKAQVHLGHHKDQRHPSISPFLYGTRNGRDIIDIRQTIYHFKIALKVLEGIYNSGGHILYHMEDPNFSKIVQPLVPQDPRIYIVNGSWMGGLLTNWEDIQSYLLETEDFYRKNPPTLPDQIQKRKAFSRKFKPLLKSLPPQLPTSLSRPNLIITFNSLSAQDLLAEAWKLQIPTIAIADSDSNPSKISYPIPANDHNLKAFFLYAQILFSPFFLPLSSDLKNT